MPARSLQQGVHVHFVPLNTAYAYTNSILGYIKLEQICADFIMLLLYFFCLHPLMAWQQQHPALSCTLLMLLNIMAMGLGCFTFFTAFDDMETLTNIKTH